MRVIYLPGVTGEGTVWSATAVGLPDHWDSVFVDWPGLGGIPPSPTVSSFDDLCDLVVDRLDRPSVVVAQSMGGVIAVRVALRHPELVSHLVLAATSCGIDIEALGATDWRPSFLEDWPSAPRWVFERGPDLTPHLPHMTVPTLLLWATQDPISPLAVGRRLVALLPNAHLITVESSEHRFATNGDSVVVNAIRQHLS